MNLIMVEIVKNNKKLGLDGSSNVLQTRLTKLFLNAKKASRGVAT